MNQSPLKILIIEDNKDRQKAFKVLFSDQGSEPAALAFQAYALQGRVR